MTIHRQVIPAFEKFGATFGPYTQTIVLEEGERPQFYLDAPPEAARSPHGHIHPHAPAEFINKDPDGYGVIWWPFQCRPIPQAKYWHMNIDEVFWSLRVYCAESIRKRDPDAYWQAERWHEEPEND
jgi:hypothetical protein